MTTTRKLGTVALGATLALSALYAGTVIGGGHQHQPSTTCTTVIGWTATLDAYGDSTTAMRAWNGLVDQGWTNPRNGNVTLLVQPGCADAFRF